MVIEKSFLISNIQTLNLDRSLQDNKKLGQKGKNLDDFIPNR